MSTDLEWTNLAQDKVCYQIYVKTVTKLKVLYRIGNYLTSYAAISSCALLGIGIFNSLS